MTALITGSLILTVLHALIPSHWLPILAIGRKENWALGQVTRVTFLSGFAHALSTVLVGLGVAVIGTTVGDRVRYFDRWVTPSLLILLGLFFIYQHHRHKHFHIHATAQGPSGKVIASLVLVMFLSPCLEIEAYFLLASAYGWSSVALLSVLFTLVTVFGMVSWVRLAFKGLLKFNWHAIEHNAGIITGATLVLTGIVSFFLK